MYYHPTYITNMPQPTIESVIEDFNRELHFIIGILNCGHFPLKGNTKEDLLALVNIARSEERKRCVEIVEKKEKEADDILKERPTNWSAMGAIAVCIDIKNTINTNNK